MKNKEEQAGEALRDSEIRYRRLFESAKDGILILDAETGMINDVNPFLVEMLGYSREELLGKRIWELGSFKDVIASQDNFMELQREKYIRYEDLPLETTDGHRIDVEFVSNVYFVERKKVIQCNIRNITERKQREDELYRLNRALKASSRSNQAMMRATDETEYMNEACKIIVEDCGYKMAWIGFAESDDNNFLCPAASVGIEDADLATSGNIENAQDLSDNVIFVEETAFCKAMLAAPQFKRVQEQALKQGYASSIVMPLMDRGRAFGVMSIYSEVPNSFPGNEMGLISELVGDLAYGIMELRLRKLHAKIQDALENSEKRYRALFDSMTEGFALHEIICDDNGIPCDYRFIEINQAFEKLTGLKRNDVLYQTHNEILPGDNPAWVEFYGKVALSGEPIEFESYSSDLKKYYQVFAYRTMPHQVAALFMDISERKKAEEILMRDKETLESIVKERAEALLDIQAKLERAKRLSDIGTLAATVAHELRNPLAAITISAVIIRRKAKDEAVREQLKNIDKMVDESDQIINNLLFYSRLGTPHHKNIVIYDIIDECVENLRRQIKKNVRLKRNFDYLKGLIMSADPIQMKEVFHNLLHNAADAVSGGDGEDDGEIEISADSYPEFIKIRIKDNGQGIDIQHQEKVFDPFFTTKAKGTGLGLTVCNQIVNIHGGSIDIESEPGNGTTVTIVLPKKGKLR
ncbi:MAG: hypothetical protein A2020_10110 [Lentisphaerae bacterium GWF2_45_14]|nr:MAG: hypothetical protein A2020_10110 [Lentisphaerae bacterium GWF2_45_14]